MRLRTASEVISYARRLETESAVHYLEAWDKPAAQNYDGVQRNDLLAIEKENGKNIAHIERAYYSVISDALEGGFAFDLPGEALAFSADGAGVENRPMAILAMLEVEQGIMEFYEKVAGQALSLIPDISRAFLQVARKRAKRIEDLKSKIE